MAKPRLLTLPIALLDEPSNPARTAMDTAQLESLAQSLREVGLIEPLVVEATDGGRYRVSAGHRRLLAARLAGLLELPCVLHARAGLADAVKIHENVEREELSPVDEGRYYHELYLANGEDLGKVASLVRKALAYVDRRIQLVINDPDVREALRDGKIALTVAEELIRVRDPEERSYYLEYAIRGGCSARQAREWRAQANARTEQRERAAAAAFGTTATSPAAAAAPLPGSQYLHLAAPHELSGSKDLRRCLYCDDEHEEWRMYRKFVCGACADRHLAPLEKERPSHG